MQRTHCRLFRVMHMVGLQCIKKKPFSLSAVEFGFSCSSNTYIYNLHACTRTWPVYVHIYIQDRVSPSNTMFACTLYQSTTFCSLLRNIERQNFDLLRTHVYNREKKRTNCATGPIVRFRWFVFLSPCNVPRHPTSQLPLFFSTRIIAGLPHCALCRYAPDRNLSIIDKR